MIGIYPWTGDSVLSYEAFRFNFLADKNGTGRTLRTGTSITGYNAIGIPEAGDVVLNNVYPPFGQFIIFDASTGQVKTQIIGLADTSTGRKGVQDAYATDAVLGYAAGRRAFWAGATHYRYQLDLWTPEGRLLSSITRTPPWYSAYDSVALHRRDSLGDYQVKPLPYLKAIRETQDGLLLVLYGIASRNWKPTSVPDNEDPHAYARSAHDGMLDIRDAKTGSLVMSEWMSLPMRGFVNDTLMYDRVESDDGIWRIDVYRLQIARP